MLNKEKTITISLDEYYRLLGSQKQVDELKGQLQIAKLQGLTEGYLDGVKAERNSQIIKPAVVELPKEITQKIKQQAVKDTAKEILKWLVGNKHLFNRTHEIGFEKPRTSYLIMSDEIEELAEKYGVVVK